MARVDGTVYCFDDETVSAGNFNVNRGQASMFIYVREDVIDTALLSLHDLNLFLPNELHYRAPVLAAAVIVSDLVPQHRHALVLAAAYSSLVPERDLIVEDMVVHIEKKQRVTKEGIIKNETL